MGMTTMTIACAVALVIAVTALPAKGQSREEEALRDFVSDLLDTLDADESIEEEVMREAVDQARTSCPLRSIQGSHCRPAWALLLARAECAYQTVCIVRGAEGAGNADWMIVRIHTVTEERRLPRAGSR